MIKIIRYVLFLFLVVSTILAAGDVKFDGKNYYFANKLRIKLKSLICSVKAWGAGGGEDSVRFLFPSEIYRRFVRYSPSILPIHPKEFLFVFRLVSL